jgi:dTDP-4-amino-4,6-dideoxygalactose transaminase
MKIDKPAIIGGKPVFSEPVSIIKPPLYRYTKTKFLKKIKTILDSGLVTNGVYVENLENRIQDYLKVNSAVALSSCTSGLILAMRLLGLRNKEVLLPSFTFSATALACCWNNCKSVLVDCDRETFNISPEDIRKKISKKTAAIIGVHVFGNPCDIKKLRHIAQEYKIKIIYDSAHGFGASVGIVKIGNFGDAEIFSCSPTKLLITAEGGIVTTNNQDLARELKLARNYGNKPDYTCAMPGLSARMTEINALIGLEMLKEMDIIVKNRNRYARLYRDFLAHLPGISFQKTAPSAVHAYKDFAIVIDSNKFGIKRDLLYEALNKENIMTRKYFHPAVHQLKAFAKFKNNSLPNTAYLSENVLCLPIYSYMDEGTIKDISFAIERIHSFAKDINNTKAKGNF